MKKFLKIVIFLLAAGGAGAMITCAGDEDFNQRVWEAALIAAAWLLAAILGKICWQMPDKQIAPKPLTQRRYQPRRRPCADIIEED